MAKKETVGGTVRVQIDAELKKSAEQVIKDIGSTPTKAITEFYEQVVLQKGLPFKTLAEKTDKAVIKPRMPQDWLNWTKENIDRGCDPAGIRDILLKNNFSLAVIKEAMGEKFPNDKEAISTQPEANDVDYEGLANIKITKTAKRIETDLLQLYTLENFLSNKECDDLVELISKSLRPSTITMYDDDKYFRTSTTCDMALMKNAMVEKIDKKIAQTIGINPSFSEGIQAQRYDIGQQFKSHTDYFEPRTEEYRKFASVQGNRTWTFMVYLNNTIQGGGTHFVNLDKTFYPKKGMAVIWNNLYPDGTPNPDTLHWGLPVEQGVKVIITKWFREKGNGDIFNA
jgi:prolyl 4-hydroxylase